jgi:hypothetical protein
MEAMHRKRRVRSWLVRAASNEGMEAGFRIADTRGGIPLVGAAWRDHIPREEWRGLYFLDVFAGWFSCVQLPCRSRPVRAPD